MINTNDAWRWIMLMIARSIFEIKNAKNEYAITSDHVPKNGHSRSRLSKAERTNVSSDAT